MSESEEELEESEDDFSDDLDDEDDSNEDFDSALEDPPDLEDPDPVAAIQAAQQAAKNAPLGVPRRKSLKRVANPKPNQIKAARKGSAYEIMQRRQQVQRLRLRGLSIGEIAKQLKVSFLTAQKDLECVQKDNHGTVDAFQQAQFVGESLCMFDEVVQNAWREFESAPPGSKHRLQSLDLVRITQGDKFKALQDVGMLQKAAQQIEHKYSMDLPWNDDLKDAVIDKLLQTQLSTTLALPTPDYDHDPGKNVIIDAVLTDSGNSK